MCEASGGGTPGGSNTQIQYNNASAFGGASGLTTDGSDLTVGNQTASRILSTDSNKKVVSLDTATYPSLTELSYVKGVTSAIQTQINAISLTNLQAILYFYADPSVSVAITNQPVAETYLISSARSVQKFDATKYTAVRIVCNVTAASASANTPRLYPKYKTTYANGDAIGTFTTIGTGSSPEVASLAAVDVAVSSWITLPAGAIADVFFTIAEIGGDAAADPAFGALYLEFRV